MNPLSLEDMEEGKKHARCSHEQNTLNTCFLLDTGEDNGEFQRHAHSLTLPFFSPASLPPPLHSLPPFPKRKDQALNPSESHICLLENVK